jgi:hypothetical protein
MTASGEPRCCALQVLACPVPDDREASVPQGRRGEPLGGRAAASLAGRSARAVAIWWGGFVRLIAQVLR